MNDFHVKLLSWLLVILTGAFVVGQITSPAELRGGIYTRLIEIDSNYHARHRQFLIRIGSLHNHIDLLERRLNLLSDIEEQRIRLSCPPLPEKPQKPTPGIELLDAYIEQQKVEEEFSEQMRLWNLELNNLTEEADGY